jgi:hypothetical protein
MFWWRSPVDKVINSGSLNSREFLDQLSHYYYVSRRRSMKLILQISVGLH